MSNNNLMPIKENVFDKIKKFFLNLFGKNVVVENNELNTSENVIKNEPKFKDSIVDNNMKTKETEEQKLLNLQKLIREKRISEDDLTIEEQNKLRNLYKFQIEKLRNSIMQKRDKVLKIKYEQKRKSHANI